MTTTYKKLGFPLLYPENWAISDEQVTESPRSVSFLSPEGAMWVLQVFEEGTPQELAAQALETMRQEYPELEAHEIIEQVEGHDILGFEMNFYCLDFVVTATARSLRRGKETLVLFCQAETRDFDRLEIVFRAMLVSILRAESRE